MASICLTLLVSCGKSKEEKVAQKATITKGSAVANKKMIVVDSDGVVNISMVTDDRMKFNLKKITVKAGQKIKLTLTHTGRLHLKLQPQKKMTTSL